MRQLAEVMSIPCIRESEDQSTLVMAYSPANRFKNSAFPSDAFIAQDLLTPGLWLLAPLLVLLVLLFPSSALGISKQLNVQPVAISVTVPLADIDQGQTSLADNSGICSFRH
jgi:hypothetical protein